MSFKNEKVEKEGFILEKPKIADDIVEKAKVSDATKETMGKAKNIATAVFVTDDYAEAGVRTKRLIAIVIDLFILGLVSSLFVFATMPFVAAVTILYFIVTECIFGTASIGKKFMNLGIKIHDHKQEGQTKDFEGLRLLIRSVVKGFTLTVLTYASSGLAMIFAIPIFLIVFFAMRFSSGGRLPHDWLSGSYVDSTDADKSIGYLEKSTIYNSIDKVLDGLTNNGKVKQ